MGPCDDYFTVSLLVDYFIIIIFFFWCLYKVEKVEVQVHVTLSNL